LDNISIEDSQENYIEKSEQIAVVNDIENMMLKNIKANEYLVENYNKAQNSLELINHITECNSQQCLDMISQHDPVSIFNQSITNTNPQYFEKRDELDENAKRKGKIVDEIQDKYDDSYIFGKI
jgi:hypothetical protein